MPGPENEITIVVRARSSVRQGFDAARKEAELAGKDAGEDYTRKFGDTVGIRMMQHVQAPLARVGKQMGEVLGEHTARGVAQVVAKGIASIPDVAKGDTEEAGRQIGQGMGEEAGRTIGERIREHLRRVQSTIRSRVTGSRSEGLPDRDERERFLPRSGGDDDTDRARQSLLSRMLGFGREAAGAFSSGFGQAVSTFFSGDLISLLVKALAGGALVAALSSAIGAAITSAVLLGLGGGVIGAGIAAAFKDPQVQGAAKDLGDKIKKMFTGFGEPFKRELIGAFNTPGVLEKFAGFIDRLEPKLKEMGKSMAPLVGKLGQGFVEMLDEMMPGIVDAVEASKPLFETLAKHLPQIGEAIGNFFSKISEQGDDANVFFDDLLSAIEFIIEALGTVVAGLTSVYDKVSFVVHFAIDVFDSWKTGVEGAIKAVQVGFVAFRRVVINQLEKILDGAATALSWVPGVGPKLRQAQQKFAEFRRNANAELAKVEDKTVKFTIKPFGLTALREAANLARIVSEAGYAHGGITGAANGGMRSGLTMVGERGRELVSLAPGTRVHSNEDTERMLAGVGEGDFIATARWLPSAAGGLADALAAQIRIDVQRKGNGSVQATYGQGR